MRQNLYVQISLWGGTLIQPITTDCIQLFSPAWAVNKDKIVVFKFRISIMLPVLEHKSFHSHLYTGCYKKVHCTHIHTLRDLTLSLKTQQVRMFVTALFTTAKTEVSKLFINRIMNKQTMTSPCNRTLVNIWKGLTIDIDQKHG